MGAPRSRPWDKICMPSGLSGRQSQEAPVRKWGRKGKETKTRYVNKQLCLCPLGTSERRGKWSSNCDAHQNQLKGSLEQSLAWTYRVPDSMGSQVTMTLLVPGPYLEVAFHLHHQWAESWGIYHPIALHHWLRVVLRGGDSPALVAWLCAWREGPQAENWALAVEQHEDAWRQLVLKGVGRTLAAFVMTSYPNTSVVKR